MRVRMIQVIQLGWTNHSPSAIDETPMVSTWWSL